MPGAGALRPAARRVIRLPFKPATRKAVRVHPECASRPASRWPSPSGSLSTAASGNGRKTLQAIVSERDTLAAKPPVALHDLVDRPMVPIETPRPARMLQLGIVVT